MEISKIYHFLFELFVTLNFTAIVLLFFRSDKKMIFKDVKTFLKINSFIVCLGVVFLTFSILPFTIPYSIENIYNRIKNK
jgi:hypothetical protein